MLSKKRSLSDIEEGSAARPDQFDDCSYRKKVLLLSGDQSEHDYDVQLTNEAKDYGILPKDVGTSPGSIDTLAASLSVMTFSSEPHNLSSTHSSISQSTMPTSCGSSEQRPTTQASYATGNLPSPATTPSVLSTSSKKARFGLRGGFRRLSGRTKRKSDDGGPMELMALEPKSAPQLNGAPLELEMNQSRILVAGSFRSMTSSKAQANHAEETLIVYDEEAMRRSQINIGLKALRQEQSEAAMRFVVFEARAYAVQKKQHEAELLSLDQLHDKLQREKSEENTRLEEQLEERQLKAEEDLRSELDEQKRRALIRLRHMEAYCKEASPSPSAPKHLLKKSLIVNLGGRVSPGSGRTVTKYDFDQLSQQYHLINTMDTLHESKINVLRGTQEQRTMALMTKNENALEKLVDDLRKERAEVEKRQETEVERLRGVFARKKARMVMRWRLREGIETKKLEADSGLAFGPLPVLGFPEVGAINGGDGAGEEGHVGVNGNGETNDYENLRVPGVGVGVGVNAC